MGMSSNGAGIKAEPNVTPMIDVMLVLLIIFMIIIPTLTSGLQATPPSGANLKPRPEEETDQILGIDQKGQYFLNREPIENSSLGAALHNIYSVRQEDKILYIKADKDLDYGIVLDALDIAANNGVRMSAMITDQEPGTESSVETDREASSVGLPSLQKEEGN